MCFFKDAFANLRPCRPFEVQGLKNWKGGGVSPNVLILEYHSSQGRHPEQRPKMRKPKNERLGAILKHFSMLVSPPTRPVSLENRFVASPSASPSASLLRAQDLLGQGFRGAPGREAVQRQQRPAAGALGHLMGGSGAAESAREEWPGGAGRRSPFVFFCRFEAPGGRGGCAFKTGKPPGNPCEFGTL